MKKSLLLLFAAIICFCTILPAQNNISLLGQLTLSELGDANATGNDIWGYASGNGNEYAIMGMTTGTAIADVTDPANPQSLFFIPGPVSTWRDMKVWGNYAYIVHDATNFGQQGVGLLIVDMSNLPASIDTFYWTGSADPMLGGSSISQAHNIFIDENGFGYLIGADYGAGGVIMLDLANPVNPVVAGIYDDAYVHDAYVRGDTLWTAEIYNGWFAAIDIADKSNPVPLAYKQTSGRFTHNMWLSDDGNYLFTTDEISGGYIDAYDVSDLSNIGRLDMYQSNPGSGTVPHNTFYHNGFIVTSYYRDGVTVADANRPQNLVETGQYDTSPLEGSGFNGAWGVYPYLPSGNLLVSDMESGLFILSPAYERAAYLEGAVTDASSGALLQDVEVRIKGENNIEYSDPFGSYKTGAEAGNYTVEFYKYTYKPKTIDNVNLTTGNITTLDVQLDPADPFVFAVKVLDESGAGIPDAKVSIVRGDSIAEYTTSANGTVAVTSFYEDFYSIFAGKWGYVTDGVEDQFIDVNNSMLTLTLKTGYYDDFNVDLGWKIEGDATAGQWERAIPEGTSYNDQMANPGADVQSDPGKFAYVTGNGGASAAENDVDDGYTILTSPSFNMDGFQKPYITYYRWFFTGGGWTAYDDTLTIALTNGLGDTVIVESVTASDTYLSQWKYTSIYVPDYLLASADMRLIATTSDFQSSGHLVEAGLDAFRAFDSIPSGTKIIEEAAANLNVSPNPFKSSTIINLPVEDSAETYHLAVYNLLGQKVDEQEITGSTAEWGAKAEPGVYFIQVSNGQNIYTGKVIKTK